jgi:hypothetical protein
MWIVEIRWGSDATVMPLHFFHVLDPDFCVNSFALRILLLANKLYLHTNFTRSIEKACLVENCYAYYNVCAQFSYLSFNQTRGF